jgi:hypothetical protein
MNELRLTYAEETTDNLIIEAARDSESLIKDGKNWIKITIHRDRVIMEHGPIHTNGQREEAIATISYEWRDHKIVTIKQVHA